MKEKTYKRDDATLRDILELVCYSPPMKVIRQWTDGQCERAEKWAAAVYARASDHVCRVPKRPRHVLRRFYMSF
jgi:hypothetical protein